MEQKTKQRKQKKTKTLNSMPLLNTMNFHFQKKWSHTRTKKNHSSITNFKERLTEQKKMMQNKEKCC